MTRTTILPFAAAAALLAGCMPVPPDAAMAPPPVPIQAPLQAPIQAPAIAPVAPPPTAAAGIAGLEERKPDLCKAQDYSRYVSQPGSVIPTLGLTRAYRVVEYRGIEPQDYDPNRIVFRLDSAGNIYNIDCG